MPDNNRFTSSIYLSSSAFLTELMNVSKGIVWKNTYLANKNEDSNYGIQTEMFMAASKNLLTFDIIYQFDYATLISAGLSNDAALAAMDDKYTIPQNLKSTCATLYRKNLLEKDSITGRYKKYEERNNYYRQLMGLPNIDDTNYIYIINNLDIDPNIPIHLLPLADRYNLEQSGYLDTLLEQYPTKKYIKHLASKLIDPYVARLADRFSILYINTSESNNLIDDFKDVYNNCRYTVIRVYYNEVFRKDNELYDNFLAMAILFMAMQYMFHKYLSVDITRDFYDLESIKYIYDSYGVPFYSSIPLDYHKNIIKNINRLISYKGSTRVFFDLFDIFNYSGADIYEYYIMKTHKFDQNGTPIFVYNPDGSLNKREMYDIKFGKVKIYNDPPLELSDASNHLTYDELTATDPYWNSDQELLDKLYNEEYNFLETKYIGIQTIFNMMNIVNEAAYFIQIIMSNKTGLKSTTVYYSNTTSNINIFDMLIYLSALICKKYGYSGNISTELPSVAKILGFNFKDLATIVQNNIRTNTTLNSDMTLNNLLLNMNVNSISSVNSTFKNINSLKRHLTEKITNAKSRDEYFAYYNLEKVMLYQNIIESVYKKVDGTTADSFKDLLNDINPSLYIRFLSADLDIDEEIDIILILFKKACTELKYFESADGIDISNVVQYLITVLDFFKSAKSELTGYSITYIVSTKSMNNMKLFAEIDHTIETILDKDEINYLTSKIEKISELKRLNNDNIEIIDDIETIAEPRIQNESFMPLNDIITNPLNDIEIKDESTMLFDVIKVSNQNNRRNEIMQFNDKLLLLNEQLV